MFHRHTQSIEEYQNNDKPIEPLLLDGASYEKSRIREITFNVESMSSRTPNLQLT